jgi:hypothetical protein
MCAMIDRRNNTRNKTDEISNDYILRMARVVRYLIEKQNGLANDYMNRIAAIYGDEPAFLVYTTAIELGMEPK